MKRGQRVLQAEQNAAEGWHFGIILEVEPTISH